MAKPATRAHNVPADGGDFALVPVQTKTVFPTRELLRAYDMAFRQRFEGIPAPIVPGKDGDLARRLLDRYTLADLVHWLDVFFQLPDTFIQRSGYGFGIFASNIGKCITAGKVSRLNDTTMSELDAGQSFARNISQRQR